MDTDLLRPRYRFDGVSCIKLNRTQIEARNAFLRDYESGQYPLETVPCAACVGQEFRTLSQKDRYGLPLSVVICQNCGLIQTNPRMTSSAYEKFYNTAYRRLYVGDAEPTENFFDTQKFQGKRIANFIQNETQQPLRGLRVLEVGCGAGGILHFLRDLGAEVRGCDLGEEYLLYGVNKYGLPLTRGGIRSLPDTETYDLIIYSHVFEHVLDLSSELREVSKRMSADGMLYIEVPGVKNIMNAYRSDFLRLLQNAHVFHFSLKSLRNVVESAGFELVSGSEFVRSLWKRSSDPTTCIESDYEDVVRWLEIAERRRLYHRYTFRNISRVVARRWANLKRGSQSKCGE